VNKLSRKKSDYPWLQIAHNLKWTDIYDVASISISLWVDLTTKTTTHQ